MKRSAFVKVVTALGVVAVGIAAPLQAQVIPTITDAMSALKTGGSTITNYSVNNDGSQGAATGITSTEASGGKVGTFSANSALGDSQRFAVGTATNFGINASSSSTAEYTVDSRATMGLGGSNFSQTIGSSGSNLDARSSESLKESYVMNEIETQIGSSAASSYERERESGTTSTRYGHSWWGSTQNTSWNSLTDTQKQEYENSYNQERTSISTSASSAYSSSSAVREAANGVISGSFNATASEGTTNSSDSNQVTVRGVGNAANMRAGSNSVFDVQVKARSTSTMPDNNSATASGSAGASMSTTSSADASTTSFSSLFIQSF